MYTYSTWGNYRDVDEVVLSGSKSEIKEYAKKAEFVWHEDASRPNGGYYSKSIDGYREKNLRTAKQTMKVGQVKTGQIISIKNLLGINEVFLILQKQDVLGKCVLTKDHKNQAKEELCI